MPLLREDSEYLGGVSDNAIQGIFGIFVVVRRITYIYIYIGVGLELIIIDMYIYATARHALTAAHVEH